MGLRSCEIEKTLSILFTSGPFCCTLSFRFIVHTASMHPPRRNKAAMMTNSMTRSRHPESTPLSQCIRQKLVHPGNLGRYAQIDGTIANFNDQATEHIRIYL